MQIFSIYFHFSVFLPFSLLVCFSDFFFNICLFLPFCFDSFFWTVCFFKKITCVKYIWIYTITKKTLCYVFERLLPVYKKQLLSTLMVTFSPLKPKRCLHKFIITTPFLPPIGPKASRAPNRKVCMTYILDGSSEHDEHLWAISGLFLEHFKFKVAFGVSKCLNQIKLSCLLHAYAQYSGLPTYISSMVFCDAYYQVNRATQGIYGAVCRICVSGVGPDTNSAAFTQVID